MQRRPVQTSAANRHYVRGTSPQVPYDDAVADTARTWLRQGMGFSMVGAAQLLLDWGVLVGLNAAGVPLPAANVAGRAAGAALGFWANRRLTFRGHRRSPWPQLGRFALLWSALTVLSTAAMEELALTRGTGLAWLLKPLVEALLAVLSFLACRHWVYR